MGAKMDFMMKVLSTFQSQPFRIEKEILDTIVSDESDQKGKNARYYLSIALFLNLIKAVAETFKFTILVKFVIDWVTL